MWWLSEDFEKLFFSLSLRQITAVWTIKNALWTTEDLSSSTILLLQQCFWTHHSQTTPNPTLPKRPKDLAIVCEWKWVGISQFYGRIQHRCGLCHIPFLTGSHWSPHPQSGSYRLILLITGTFLFCESREKSLSPPPPACTNLHRNPHNHHIN